MATQNADNSFGFALPSGLALTGVKCPAAFLGAMGTGNHDLYTVPAGKKALYLQLNVYNANASSSTCQALVKISGVYYPLNAAVSVATATASILMGTAAASVNCSILLNAGESASVSNSVATVNAWARIIEFDDICPIVRGGGFNLASGNQTLYTCPAGKTAITLDCKAGFTYSLVNQMYNGNASTNSYYFMNVPSGQAAGLSYAIMRNNAGLATASFSAAGNPYSLGAGDFIAVNNSVSGSINAWVNLIEVST